ncbi:MAG: hypothetical protein HKO64_12865 [Xanthomonadales bacterium]|nr:hypothetical protein [Gammaproteobacteria bacterium]NNE06097.1 hypothetical protein [Xanthomonadales bacterium]NNL96506.1 hypothetical protein [Xanthomonadales bacterium]
MNRIQQISQDLLNQKLKLQMGIDPRVEISHEKLQQMWMQVQHERNLENAHEASAGHVRDRAA